MNQRIAVLLFLCVISLRAEGAEAGRKKVWKWSVGMLMAANGADVATSMGRRELNPVLGAGQFGPRATGVKVGISAVTIGTQCLILRKKPEAMRKAAYVNFAMAGATAGVAAYNTRH